MAALPRLLHDTAVAVPDIDADPASATTLGVKVPDQDQDQWCWCAITVGVSCFFDTNFSLSQCETAAEVLHQADACSRPGDDDINRMFALNEALDTFNHLAQIKDEPLSFEQVRQQIDAGRPVGVRIRFVDYSGSAHFTVIRGYLTDPVPMLVIDDPNPLYGESTWSFAEFAESYKGSGVWRQSFLTK